MTYHRSAFFSYFVCFVYISPRPDRGVTLGSLLGRTPPLDVSASSHSRMSLPFPLVFPQTAVGVPRLAVLLRVANGNFAVAAGTALTVLPTYRLTDGGGSDDNDDGGGSPDQGADTDDGNDAAPCWVGRDCPAQVPGTPRRRRCPGRSQWPRGWGE